MNTETATKILKIMLSADGGCGTCAGHLIRMFVDKFGFKEEAIKKFKKCFGFELYE